MNRSLPFTLAPLDAEPFGLWWHAYAVAFGVTRTELAQAVGIPTDRPPGPEDHAAISAATGLSTTTVSRMFTTVRPCPPEHVLRVWRSRQSSRFCPACLTEGSPLQPAWSLPLTFHCLIHGAPLAECCPACGQPPPSLMAPARITHSPTFCPFCGHDLTTHQLRPDDKATAAAQTLINTTLVRIRHPAHTAIDRERAQDDLTDLTLIALHLTQDDITQRRGFSHRMPDAAAFTTAVDLLVVAPDTAAGQDRLADLVARGHRGTRSGAIPFSWRAASPTLITRIARGRDAALTPIERIRHATTLPTITPRPRQVTDPATTRADQLPDQLWPVWAIRLTDDDSLDGPVFRSAMIAALLLAHSELQLNEITPLLPHRPSADRVAHQLRRLASTSHGHTALRILTELALALNHNDIPIDYARRRRLVADTELIDRSTWSGFCRGTGLKSGSTRRLDLARRYLYELLTGGNLATAPRPYQLAEGAPRTDHVEFCSTMPTALVTAMSSHAEGLLAAVGITGEPLTWHPPVEWVSVTSWPGADPEHTDPRPIHQALLAQWATEPHRHWAPTRAVANAIGISSHHLRHVLRAHPIGHAPYRSHRPGAVVATEIHNGLGHRADSNPGDRKPVYFVDPAWLREQYTFWGRTLDHIAAEIGCRPHTLRAFAETQGIPRRPRGGRGSQLPDATITDHPADLPELLRKALLGQRARGRVERFLIMTKYPSLNQAAIDTGIHQSTLTAQLQNLERACGGPLFTRRTRRPLGPLTPLGEQLCQQAREHLDLTSNA